MPDNSGTEDYAITLVEQAMLKPEGERETFLREACGANTTLFEDAVQYMQWEQRMHGFLQEPLQHSRPEKPPFQPGEILLHRFRVVRQIAQGGMGVVWEAIDQKLDRRVALKSGRSGHGKQLPPEVRNAREVSHPNVCKIYEIHTTPTSEGEIDFISMEFLEGETLCERLLRGPLGEREARTIALQLCAGVAEAHRNLLVHGDLKTNNVILTSDAAGAIRAVITDFGLARRIDAAPTVLGGTPAYMAPELWKGQPATRQSDIYALGVILWELRSGKAAGELDTNSLAAGRGRWNKVVARCLEPKPEARFQNATLVARALGPSRAMEWGVAVAVVTIVATVSGLVTYTRATAPTEHVRLSLAEVGAAPSAATRLKQLRGSPNTDYRFVGGNRDATHMIRVGVKSQGQTSSVHAVLADLHTGANLLDWTGEYPADQLQHVPQAIAGLVSETFHLPPLLEAAGMNASAKTLYWEGMGLLQRDETLNGALDKFEQAAKADAESAIPLGGLAEAQFLKYSQSFDKTWLDRSAESMRQAQLRNPDLAQVHQVAGLLDRVAGRPDDAIGELKRSLEIDPDNGDAYRRLGLAYENKEAKEDALAAFKKAIEKGPGNFRNYRELAEFYARRADYPMAIKQFRSALRLSQGNADLLFRLGVVYKDFGQFEEAEKALRASLAVKATPRYLDTLGVLLMYEKKNSEAVDAISRAIEIGGPQHIWWMNLGTAYRMLGNTAEANRAYTNALALAEKDLTNSPKDARVRSQVGFICARLNQRQRAQSESQQAVRLSPENADVLWMVALTDETLGHRDETLSVLAKAPGQLAAEFEPVARSGGLKPRCSLYPVVESS